MSGKRNVLVWREHELANALYSELTEKSSIIILTNVYWQPHTRFAQSPPTDYITRIMLFTLCIS